jgi:hypothetical protein
MSSYMHRSRDLELRRVRSARKSTNDDSDAVGHTKRAAANSAELGADASGVLTLDDFGGRSDALGG